MPFENVTRDSRIFWLSEAAAVLLADNLNALGANAITREERREAFERLQVPPAAVAHRCDRDPDRTARRRVTGRRRHAAAAGRNAGRSRREHRARSRADPDQRDRRRAAARPVRDIRARRAPARPSRHVAPAAAVSSENPPVRAFENYIKGLLAETPATAINYLNAALQADPTLRPAAARDVGGVHRPGRARARPGRREAVPASADLAAARRSSPGCRSSR